MIRSASKEGNFAHSASLRASASPPLLPSAEQKRLRHGFIGRVEDPALPDLGWAS
jgi:hypothetical protein